MAKPTVRERGEWGGGSNTICLIVQIVGGVLALWLAWQVLFGESSDDEQE